MAAAAVANKDFLFPFPSSLFYSSTLLSIYTEQKVGLWWPSYRTVLANYMYINFCDCYFVTHIYHIVKKDEIGTKGEWRKKI